MAELIVASGLLGMLVVTLMVMFGQMMTASTKNSLLSAGSYFAETILEREKSAALERVANGATSDVFQNLPNDGSEWITTHDENNQTEFNYRVNAEKLNLTSNPGEVWYVEVEVSWWQNGGTQESKAGFGKLNVRRGRVIYVQI